MSDSVRELKLELVAARREVEHWQREYVSACAREDEQRRRADTMAQVVQPAWMLLERLCEAKNHGHAVMAELQSDAAPILAKLEELQR